MVSDEPVSVLASASCPTVTDPGNSSAARPFIGLEQRPEEEHASSSTEPVVNDHPLEQPNSTIINTPPVNVLRSLFFPDKTFATAKQLLQHVNKSLPADSFAVDI
jgi:hypothetical protein